MSRSRKNRPCSNSSTAIWCCAGLKWCSDFSPGVDSAAALRPSAGHQLLIRRDSPLEVVVFLAADEADVFQMREVLLGRGRLAEHQMGFAEMLVGAAMARIEHQRLLVMSDRRPHLAQPPIGIANVVLDVGVARIA